MQKYQNYKTTNIKWTDQIPVDWSEIPLRKVFEDVKNINTNGDNIRMLSLVKDIGIIPYEDRGNQGNKSSEKLEKYKIVEKGDFVINKMNAVLGSLGISEYEGLVSPVYYVLRNRNEDEFISRYFELIFKTRSVQRFLRTMSKGIMEIRESVDWAELKNMALPLPTVEDQRSIVEYVNRVDKLTRDFIRQKQRYIELLKEYKQSKINELVTKGLDPNVKMKDSGIEWLGQIPEHWGKFKLKHIGTSQIGITYSPNDVVDEENGMLVLRSSNIQNGRLSLKDNVYIKKDFKVNDKQLVRDGDILICARNGSAELVGKNLLIDKSLEGNTFGAFMTVFRSDYNRYLKYFFNSDFFKSQMGLFSTTTINQLTNSILNNLVIIMPQNEVEIQSLINEICEIENKFEKLIAQSEKQLRLIKKYRQSLIYELVTGIRKP